MPRPDLPSFAQAQLPVVRPELRREDGLGSSMLCRGVSDKTLRGPI